VFPLTDGMRPKRFPIVNTAIIAACFAVWIFYELPHLNSSVLEASLYACDLNGSCNSPLPSAVSWFTAMFMHASWSHILGNMWFLAIFGKNVEDSLGRLRCLAFYVAGGFAAAALQTATTLLAGTAADARVPVLGASGAIAAVLGAYWILYPGARILTIVGIFPVRIPPGCSSAVNAADEARTYNHASGLSASFPLLISRGSGAARTHDRPAGSEGRGSPLGVNGARDARRRVASPRAAGATGIRGSQVDSPLTQNA
jgi:membrane associated rhomboid family serine protease